MCWNEKNIQRFETVLFFINLAPFYNDLLIAIAGFNDGYLIVSRWFPPSLASTICSLNATTRFTQPFVQAQMKENIKAPRHWLLWGEFTVDRWIPRTKGQQRGKCFHLMTSSCISRMPLNHYLQQLSLFVSQSILGYFGVKFHIFLQGNCGNLVIPARVVICCLLWV